jgi:peroxiredoxin
MRSAVFLAHATASFRVTFGAAFGVVGAFFLLACGGSAAPVASAKSPLLAASAPELHRPTLTASGPNGPQLSLRELHGRLVVVDFFAEYCQPCMRSLPELEQLHHDRPDLALIGIAEDPELETSVQLVQKLGLDFPIVYDQEHVLAGRYRVDGLPATFVIDRQGMVRWVSDGACERRDLEAVLDSVQ